MPFVLMCGFPSSGKSSRVEKLKQFLTEEKQATVNVITDQDFEIDKNAVYADSQKEKILRGNLKATAQRNTNKDTVTILDSGNYIKGFRYELYCATKSAQTPQCVIFCDVTPEQASKYNEGRPEGERYTQEILDALIMRFEPPVATNRWDSPLVTVHADDDLPIEVIHDALYLKKAPPPNFSTLSQPLAATNFLHELDRVTQSVIKDVMSAQETAVPGDNILIPGAADKIHYTRPLTLAELQRTRRQFISFTKTHPVDDNTKIANMFVQFLNNSIK